MVRFTHPTYRFIVFTPSLPNGKVKAMRTSVPWRRTSFGGCCPVDHRIGLGRLFTVGRKAARSPRGIPTRLHRLPRRSARRTGTAQAQRQRPRPRPPQDRKPAHHRPRPLPPEEVVTEELEKIQSKPPELGQPLVNDFKRLQHLQPRDPIWLDPKQARRVARQGVQAGIPRWSSSPPTPAGPTRPWSRSMSRPSLIHAGLLATGTSPATRRRFPPEFTRRPVRRSPSSCAGEMRRDKGALRPCRRLDPRHQDEEAD